MKLSLLVICILNSVKSLKLSPKHIFSRRQLNSGIISSLMIPSIAIAEETNVDKLNEFWTISDLYTNIKNRQVNLAAISNKNDKIKVLDVNGKSHIISILESEIPHLEKLMQKNNVRYAVYNSGGMLDSITKILNIAIPISLVSFLFLSFRNIGNNNQNSPFNQKPKEIIFDPITNVTFSDVAGLDESKLELVEIVDFLKNPEKFSKVGAEVPRGVLLDGPPGTGKTLLAKAVAGEAQVPFISASGSEFVEIFVGQGAKRVRDMFKNAKENAPCILFIDEIDSIGKQRSSNGINSNEEREQTLNQILAEMDGFLGNNGIIVLAATNRADILDNALTRPGRFDRRIPVGLPDKKGRFEILKVHSRNKPFDSEVCLKNVAAQTIGYSGASLKNLLNEAAIVAARNGNNKITNTDIEFALDRLTLGIQKKRGGDSHVSNRLVAAHEAGHALMAALTPNFDNITKVTILPRTSGIGGFVAFTPSEERSENGLYTQEYLKSQLCVSLAGRVAEELVFGQDAITIGASADLQKVRDLAYKMVTLWGFKNSTGINEFPIAWESNSGNYNTNLISSETKSKIDIEINNIVENAYLKCKSILKTNRNLLDKITDKLIEKETLSGLEIYKLLNC